MNKRQLLIILGPVLAVTVGLLLLNKLGFTAAVTAAIASWCIFWWVTEPIPIPATSLLPIALFPLFDVLDASDIALAYGSPLIIVMLGGFILSRGMESTGAHQRLAVAMIKLCYRVSGGYSDRSLVAGFMLAAALLSMWISNTATTLMLLPIALAIVEKSKQPQLTIALMLGIAYAANIGGMGTPIGTPPNLIFMQVYTETVGQRLGFVQWMQWGLPVVVVLVPIAGWWITRNLHSAQHFELPASGKWHVAEKRVIVVFLLTIILWVTRSDPFGGWSAALGMDNVNDGVIALLGALALFVVPNGRGGSLLDWEQANKIPWGMLLLFAGGICIAKAFVASGLSATLGDMFGVLVAWPVYLMMLLLCLGVSFLTETTSNTATTTLLMPVLAAAAMGANIAPELLMVPAALSASCAFMLPVATAPNAIIFSSGKVPAATMMRTGLALNVIAALVISLVFWMIATG
jgi:sodium-dependent dicarboxylate transporter 2/3/5